MKLIEKTKLFFRNYQMHFIVLFGVLMGILIVSHLSISIYKSYANNHKEELLYSPLYVQNCMYTLKYNAAKLELVNEVDNYIKSVASQSSLDGYVIVEECMNSGIDICFVLAQGENESHFGTTGLARKTNSVFNVYAFDGQSHEQISEKGKYKHPNYSVAPYIELLKKDYLVDGKTEYDLMDGQYVNKNGARYASSETYEKALLAKFMKIKQNTKIDSLYNETNKYKLFLGL